MDGLRAEADPTRKWEVETRDGRAAETALEHQDPPRTGAENVELMDAFSLVAENVELMDAFSVGEGSV